MSLLAGLSNVKKEAMTETDTVGYSQLPSDIRPTVIKMAYLDSNANGTVSLNFEFGVLEDGSTVPPKVRSMRHVEYISFQGGEFLRDGKPMRGLKTVNGICQLIAGKDLFEMGIEKKSVKIGRTGQEQIVEREVITDLLNEKVNAGILHAKVDKQAKNNQTGKWENSGETREVNEFDKFFDIDTLQTSSEKAGGLPAKFAETWKAKYVTGEVFNKAKGTAASGATQGAPAQAVTQTAAPANNLFG